MSSIARVLFLVGVCLVSRGVCEEAAAPEKGTDENLVVDGGFESLREVVVAANEYIYRAIDGGMDLGDGPIVYLPANLSQFAGIKTLKVIEGKPGEEVHSGTRALVLNGSYYMKAKGRVTTGDVLKIRFFAKGKGRVRLILALYTHEGRYSQAVPNPVAVDTDAWTQVEHRLDTKDHPDLGRFVPRLEASGGDVYIDDLTLVKQD